MSTAAKPSVLIIGGSFAGVAVAKQLHGTAEVTVVDKKDYFEITYANVRAIVDPSLLAKTTFPFTDLKRIGRFIQGTVVELSSLSATLETGQVLRFDYAVIAIGSGYVASWAKPQAVCLQDRLAELKGESEKLLAAPHIVVIGGGPVGVETAAEILESHPGKQLTLVSSSRALLAGYPSLSAPAIKWLQSHGGKVVLEDRVVTFPEGLPGVVRLASGTVLPADYVLMCCGSTSNTGFLASSLGGILDAKGLVKVDANLQVIGHANMWAVGDCNSLPETKLGYLAHLQGVLTGKNVAATIRGSRQVAWKPYGGMSAMLVTLGHRSGVGIVSGIPVPWFVVGMLKSRDLFVNKVRRQVLD